MGSMDLVCLHLHARLQQHRSVYSLQYWCMREKDRTDVVPLGRQQPGASGRELLASLGPDLSGDDSGLAAWPMSKPLGHRREANHVVLTQRSGGCKLERVDSSQE